MILWIIVLSIQPRNNHVDYGGDTLMRLSLFWGMFLPLGAFWSLDSRRLGKPAPVLISNFATFGLIVLNASVFLFTALLKDGSNWRSDFDAVYYAVGMRDISTPFGEWLFQHAPMQFFQLFTVGTLWLEFAVPIILLIPVRSEWLRMLAVVLVVFLHLGIGSTLSVGLFPAISMACISIILPTSFWTNLAKSRLARFSLCSPPGIAEPRLDLPVVSGADQFAEPNSCTKSDRNESRGNRDLSQLPRTIMNVVCRGAIALGLMWNITAVSSFQPPEPLRRVAIAAGLYQDWAMFAPNPRGVSVWFVVEGELSNGQKVDLLEPILTGDFTLQQSPAWDQSENVLLNHEHWRKYLTAIRVRADDGLKLAGYACRTWNAEHSNEERLENVTFTVASSKTLPSSERAEPAYQQVGHWNCT